MTAGADRKRAPGGRGTRRRDVLMRALWSQKTMGRGLRNEVGWYVGQTVESSNLLPPFNLPPPFL
jgi:hypothetical protein